MIVINHSMLVITEVTQDTLTDAYSPGILYATNGKPLPFAVRNIIVNRRIMISDPFDERFQVIHEDDWLVTPEQFKDAFDIVDDANRSETFALIIPKK